MAVDVEALLAANRAAYEAGRAPAHEHPTTVLTEADLPKAATWDDIPENINLIDAPPLQLDLDKWLYASDLHVPLHNREMIKRLVSVGLARGVEHLVLGGDLADFDSLSTHPKTERQAGYRRTKEVLGDLLQMLGSHFNLYILPGNHDARFMKKLDEAMDFSDVIWASLAGRVPGKEIQVTSLDYIYIGPPETGWVVGHPRYFSTVPARGGADVAMIQHRNVVGAHNHVVGLMQSRCGRYWSIDPGHMTEPNLTPYKMRSEGLSKYPAWKAGFLLVEHNVPRLMSDGLVDWQEYQAA